MISHAMFGYSRGKKSRYYIDPTVKNGKVVVKKAADPEKVKELQELKSRRSRTRRDDLDSIMVLRKGSIRKLNSFSNTSY